jgi:hypothetical protein
LPNQDGSHRYRSPRDLHHYQDQLHRGDGFVTHDFKFYSDSQDFLEGLPVSSIPEIIFLSKYWPQPQYGSALTPQTPSINGKQDLINQQEAAQAPGRSSIRNTSPFSRSCTAANLSLSTGDSAP